MPSQDDNINYNYKGKDYVPSLGNNQRIRSDEEVIGTGYHDLNKLRQMIKEIQAMARATITVAEKDLKDYALTVEPESRLAQAQAQEWPSELGEPKGYISYEQYKSLEDSQTRGSEFIRKAYENNVRGPFGTNSIDVITAISAVKNEADNIEKFLDNYIGDVSETAEYRALELLQDWAEEGVQYARGIGTVFTQRVEKPLQIPTSELDQIGEDDARSYQAIFQTKVNTANKEISQLNEDLRKEYSYLSEIYYTKYLGPSLKFQRKVITPLTKEVGSGSFLSRQASQADQAMGADFVSILADQMKRNQNFDTKMENLLLRITARDSYANFVRQLNSKIENETPTPFTTAEVTPEEIEGFKNFTDALNAALAESNEFASKHSLLDGRDDDDAHSQYLLKAGDTITGDILMEAGIKIGGMVPSTHRHRGPDVDGTEQIHGADIVDLVTTAIKKDEAICYPINLRHVNNSPFTGTNNVTLINSQIAWDCDPNLTFEVQIVPVSHTALPAPPITNYCVTTLYETDLSIVAGLGSDFDFFTFVTTTAVYNYNWTTGILTRIAGVEGTFGDATGDSIANARFSNINDVTQDFYDGRVYIADKTNRKVKMTGKAASSGHSLPMDISTVYTAPYEVRRLDSLGVGFLNTVYVLIGPDAGGNDHVIKLDDLDGNDLTAGTFTASTIAKLSGVYSSIKDIAVTPNGFVYLLGQNDILYQYDPNSDSVKQFDIAETASAATSNAITSDHENNIYITYSSG